MMNTNRVLISGSNGYIGSVLAPLCSRAGFDVVGLDAGYFDECTLVEGECAPPTIRKDIRDVELRDLEGFDAVIHLAALSNDPIGNLNAAWTDDVNVRGSVRLAKAAKAAGVQRFVFSSSCIIYGASEAASVNEESPLDPKTEYARSKVAAERAITALADDAFAVTCLRNGTVYGLSPRMRFDTVLNNLVGSALTTGKVTVCSDGTPWRPVVHVQDVARAFITVLKAPVELVNKQTFNTGADTVNHQVIELAERVTSAIPGCRLEVLAEAGADQRTYRSDFRKFERTFPEFRIQWPIEEGVRELSHGLMAIPLGADLFVDKHFTRLKWLRHLIDSRQLDEQLRWTAQTAPGMHEHYDYPA